MFAIYISMAALGLAAIDPVGIAIMPLLLVQKRPYARSWLFLTGSFMSLLVLGLAGAGGLGRFLLRFQKHEHWLIQIIEFVAGLILLAVAGVLFWQLRTKPPDIEPSGRLLRWLRASNWQLFGIGAGLVAVQSILDVVFIIAMVHIGQLHLSIAEVVIAVIIYSFSALLIQASVIIAFYLVPLNRKQLVLQKTRAFVQRYANQAVVVVSLLLGILLIVLAIIDHRKS